MPAQAPAQFADMIGVGARCDPFQQGECDFNGGTGAGRRDKTILDDLALSVLERQSGGHPTRVFTYQGKPIRQVNMKAWKNAVKRAGIKDFRWHDLRHSWASWLRQNDVPTWVLQELGGWKSEVMVRRYAHMSVKHWQPHADQLIFKDIKAPSQVSEKIEAVGPKFGHRAGPPRLYLVE